MSGKLLFVAYGGGHVAALAPVARAASQAGYHVSFLALTTAREALRGATFELLGFTDFWGLAPNCARDYGLELTGSMSLSPSVSREESIAYYGISFAELIEDLGESNARLLYAQHGRQAFFPTRFMGRVLDALQPDAVIATNSPRAERAAIVAAGLASIPSACVVDLFALREIDWCGQPGYADRICVLNSFVRNLFISHGRLEREVIVTGNPAFDDLASAQSVVEGRALRDRRWSAPLKNILWAPTVEPSRHPFTGQQADPRLPDMVERELREFVRRHKDYRLIIRFHPSQQKQFVAQERVDLSPNSEPLPALLHAVDAVVVTASTVGLQASMAGRPVFSVDLSVFTPDTRYAEFGISHGLRKISDLEAALLDGVSAKANENKEVFTHQGGAAGNVLAQIEILLEKRSQ